MSPEELALKEVWEDLFVFRAAIAFAHLDRRIPAFDAVRFSGHNPNSLRSLKAGEIHVWVNYRGLLKNPETDPTFTTQYDPLLDVLWQKIIRISPHVDHVLVAVSFAEDALWKPGIQLYPTNSNLNLPSYHAIEYL